MCHQAWPVHLSPIHLSKHRHFFMKTLETKIPPDAQNKLDMRIKMLCQRFHHFCQKI